MFNNLKIKRKLPGLLSIVALFALLGLSVQVLHEKEQSRVSQLLVTIDDFEEKSLISADDVHEFLEKHFNSIQDRKISMLDLSLIEEMLVENVLVENAEVYVDNMNRLHIEIWTKKPFFRLYTSSSESVYLSRTSEVLPLQKKHVVKVPIVSGNTSHLLDTAHAAELEGIIELLEKMEKDPFLSALIEQVYIMDNHEVELIPKVGETHILFGEVEDIDQKLNKLSSFYRSTAQKVGLNSFETINLKIKGQVICEIKDERT